MGKDIIVNCGRRETRAAFLEDRRVVEVYIERASQQRVVGNIYKGRVENVLPGMSAAFVNIGLERNAFLYVDDARDYEKLLANGSNKAKNNKRKGRGIRDVLKQGQSIIVQVTKEPIGTKGARVVTHLTIPGRYLVLMPTVEHIGVSRRIQDEKERERLKKAAKALKPKGMGLIVRTLAEGQSQEELEQDIKFLTKVWEQIQRRGKRTGSPALLYKDHDLVYRLIRDWFSREFSRFIVDSREEYQKVLEILDTIAPHLRSRVFYYHDENIPIFEFYGVEEDLKRALKRKVWLDSGGYLVIDQTEALTSIDVNTGKYTGSKNLADTVLKTNIEAAREIARQLRLRDIGGIIIIDFIDMASSADEEKVLAALEAELKNDRSKTHILGFTNLGMVEMTRKKTRQNIGDYLQRPCPYCGGTGRVLSEETLAFNIEREIRQFAREHDVEAMMVEVHPSVAAMLIGAGGANLKELEKMTGKTIFVRGSDDRHWEDVEIVYAGSRDALAAMAVPVREGQIIDVEVEEPHMTNPVDGISRLHGYVVDIEGAGRHVGERLTVEITKVFRTYAKGRMLS
ncbi:MAG: Rne/Rng family ribonuclease [Firmicutes bacterium]|jgi:ribonuclease G|nr:Rne/Rng family ribonuclease [Bacillota bacterium]